MPEIIGILLQPTLYHVKGGKCDFNPFHRGLISHSVKTRRVDNHDCDKGF
jgi:hypothetical protein